MTREGARSRVCFSGDDARGTEGRSAAKATLGSNANGDPGSTMPPEARSSFADTPAASPAAVESTARRVISAGEARGVSSEEARAMMTRRGDVPFSETGRASRRRRVASA